jgi:hypothetical protein
MTNSCRNHGKRGNISVDVMLPTALQEIRSGPYELDNSIQTYRKLYENIVFYTILWGSTTVAIDVYDTGH